MGGQRSLTAWASLRPSIDPGISISVKTTVMSRRASSRRIRLVGVRGLQNFEPGFLDHVDRGHADQNFDFDDEHHLC